jgi:two-component system, cell cycle sensor histidine kinase and response regulator CckA
MKVSFSFKNALIFNFIIVAIVPLILIGFITLYIFTGYLEKEITRKNFLLAKSVSGEIGAFIGQPKDMLRQIETMIEGGGLHNEDLFAASLESVISNYPVFEMIEVIDQEGMVKKVVPFRRDYIGLNLSGKPFFKEIEETRDFCWSSTFISPATGEPTLTIALPLRKGILAGILNLGVLGDFIDRLKSGPMEIGVLDRNGTFIAHSDRSNVYQRVNVAALEGVRQALLGIEGNYSVRQGGQKVFLSVALVPQTDWPVVVIQMADQAFAPVNRVRNIFWIGIGVAVILALIMALFRVKKVLRPLSRLISHAKRIAKGDYDFPSQPKSYPEIDELSGDFRMMAEAVAGREETLQQSEKRFRDLFNSISDFIYTQDIEGRFLSVNPAMSRIFRYDHGELIGRSGADFMKPELRPLFASEYLGRIKRDGYYEGVTGYFAKDGRKIYIEYRSSLVEPGDEKAYISGTGRDVTERVLAEREIKKLQEQMLQSKKMEAIGTLAGGIAHDFNNLLMGIQGNVSLMLMNLDPGNPYYERLRNMEQQIRRGADLTKQLLGFARGGKYEVKPTDLNEIIRNQCQMFGRTKKEITVQEKYEKDLWVVDVDQGQIEQVLLNLYVNASQAMPGGGELFVQTENVMLDEEHGKPFDLASGKYVRVSVTDTGVGIDANVLERIFDPFFTTRAIGKGTGLGLASAYGIIKNHDGIIDVHSEKGKGSTFNIYLPATESEIGDRKSEVGEDVRTGDETILLVDDEDIIIDVGEDMLNMMGYKVLIARSGKEAVEIVGKTLSAVPSAPDLVILDMIMPDMGGGETFDKLKEIDPGIKVLLSSGYSINGQATEILNRGCKGFIQKPFDIKGLSLRIREILDKP